jgi:tetratricopeptide (TPR) repeat protein
MSGDYEEAYAGLEEAATLYHQIGDRAFYNGSRSEIGHVLRRQGRYPEAAAIYAETPRVWPALGQHAAIAHELECLAYIAAACGQGERAARLFGVAEALRESIGTPMTAYERREYDQALAQLRAQADEGALNAAWAKGRTLTLADAVQYGLA